MSAAAFRAIPATCEPGNHGVDGKFPMPPLPMWMAPNPYQTLVPSRAGVAAMHVLSSPHMCSAMLVWVPGPGHGEQMVEPGSDEYSDWHGVTTDLEHLLP